MPPQREVVSAAPAPTADGKRKTNPASGEQPQKKAPRKDKHPVRKTLHNIKYNKIVAPPFPTEYDPEDFPFKVDGKDYFWLVSEKATTYFEQMGEAADSCCADSWGVYIYNDFTGYGEIELLENAVNAFEKEWKKSRGRKSEELFWRVEALALFLFGDPGEWGMCDDGERVSALRRLIASMFLETFILLKKDNLLTPDGPLKDVGFVAAVIANCRCVDRRKLRKVVSMCRDAGITVALGPEEFEYDEGVDLDKFITENDDDDDGGGYEYDDSDEDSEEESEVEENGGFKRALQHYVSVVGTNKLGGHKFDLSKWSYAKLKRHSLGIESDDELELATGVGEGRMRGL